MRRQALPPPSEPLFLICERVCVKSLSLCFLSLSACGLSHFSRVRLLVILWTVACQAPLFMGFSRQGYWSGLPCLPPGDLPDPGIKPTSLVSPALAGRLFTSSATWEAPSSSVL